MPKKTQRNAQIRQCLQAGMTYEQVGERFGISRGRVCQIVKDNNMRIQGALVRDTKLTKDLVQQDLNLREQLIKSHSQIVELTTLLNNAVKGDVAALAHVQQLGATNVIDTYLKALREGTSLLEAYTKASKTAFDMQHAIEFKQRVSAALKKHCDSETLSKIIEDLRAEKQLDNVLDG